MWRWWSWYLEVDIDAWFQCIIFKILTCVCMCIYIYILNYQKWQWSSFKCCTKICLCNSIHLILMLEMVNMQILQLFLIFKNYYYYYYFILKSFVIILFLNILLILKWILEEKNLKKVGLSKLKVKLYLNSFSFDV